MTSKLANWLFFTMILTHIAVVLFLSFFGEFISIGITANFFLGQAIVMVPAILFLLLSRQKPAEHKIAQSVQPGIAPISQPAQLGIAPMTQPVRSATFRRIRISSLLMIVLCTFLIMPLVTVLNTLTMFFTDNAVAAIESDILSVPFPVMFFMIGIFGPFCEEFVFRGIIYGSYAGWSGKGETSAGGSKAGRSGGLWAIMLSALTFGLMHMNFNQAVYAFAIGVFLALLVEAAGSLWASVFCHMLFNSFQVLLMYGSRAVLGSAYAEAVSETAGELTRAQLQAGLAVYLVIAAIATPIAGCCIAWIVKNEGRQEEMRALFHPAAGKTAQKNTPGEAVRREPLLTVPLIVAIVLCLGFMSLELFL
ncbi:MAG: CPBP family intramembrane metalloprotease [Lachnospiraceae bacterium]|nr:CPBP family intramembrane metalloprotease [Lachnospiraceae bacterium]